MTQPETTVDTTIICSGCGNVAPEHQNFCDWSCAVASAKAYGGVTYLPNGLPVGSISADGSMWEHEHGDHATYMFPVEADFAGNVELVTTRDDAGSVIVVADRETHALIYTDGCVALTMYEFCYALWSLRSGRLMSGSLWKSKEWRLTPESLAKIEAASKRSAETL